MARGFRFAAAIVAASLFGFAQEQPGAPEPPHDPAPAPDPCSCTIPADLTGGKIDANGKINVQVKISGSVKSTKKSEDKIQPMLTVHQYFVYTIDGRKTWIKMALPLPKVDIDLFGGAQTCGTHPDKFEKE